MTKQLRKQFILVNMLLVGTVLLVVFAALGVSTYRRQVQDSQRVLERYFMEKGNTPSPKLDFGAHRDWKDFPMRFSFCAVLDSDGGLVSYQSENLTLSRQTVEQAVQDSVDLLAPGGRLAVISFHSLEDRIVKNIFAQQAKGCICPPEFPVCVCGKKPLVKLVTRKPIVSGPAELEENPRARSAKLRVAEKL